MPMRSRIARMESVLASAGFSSRGAGTHKYEEIPSSESVETRPTAEIDLERHPVWEQNLKRLKNKSKRRLIAMGLSVMGIIFLLYFAVVGYSHKQPQSCDTIQSGYQCQPKISHYWGQYSPYFKVPSEIDTNVPPQCKITFAQILSRHGARDPTASKTTKYNETINRIHSLAKAYSKDYTFIKDYSYTLGADQLSVFGQQQMINSGVKYYDRFRALARQTTPFIRSSGQDRVVESAQNWTQGFHDTLIQDSSAKKYVSYPYNIVVIPEETGQNNTLSHGLCTVFENSTTGDDTQAEWMSIFTPPITARLNKNLPGVNFTSDETIYMMDLCPFNTVANDLGTISPFCSLFTEPEWQQYDYYQSLGKYYGYGSGNALGPTQGVGFTNELIARLTNTAVHDHTSTNSTLDSNPVTFPVGKNVTLYADFSHDNDLTGIFSALGLYNATTPLSNASLESSKQTQGYSASWTVPFAARAYFEKMACAGVDEELVRVVVNDRVIPLENCGGDALGRCKLSKFVESLSFARAGGYWGQCLV